MMKSKILQIKEMANCAISITRRQKQRLEKIRESLEYEKGRAVSKPIMNTEQLWAEHNHIQSIDRELAEIDENLIRYDLHYIDRGDHLRRRKELYEIKHPETKHNAYFRGNQFIERSSADSAPFN